jgi:hypothetical protein
MSHNYHLDDLRFALQRGPYRDHCFLCREPLERIPPGYVVIANNLNGDGFGDVCDPCASRHVPELLAARALANQLRGQSAEADVPLCRS